MDIWTERLQRRHLPLREACVRRTDGAVTPNDLPAEKTDLAGWFDACAAEAGRRDYLITVYETPVGVAGLRPSGEHGAALYLLLGEVQYNLLRTATYAVQRMLDHAFQDPGCARVTVRADVRFPELLAAFARMGFLCAAQDDGTALLSIEPDAFRQRKYLF